MREILFRGKDVDKKEWVYGGYSLYPHVRFPCTPTVYKVDEGCWHPIEVIPDTVGQYTGLTDKNGRKIFENDIIAPVLQESESCFKHEWPLMQVKSYCGSFCLYDATGRLYSIIGGFAPAVTLEVKGNIHDNPELLGGESHG